LGGSGRSNGSENEGRDDPRETREDTDSGDELKRFVPADAAWDVAAERTEDTGDLPVKWQRELQAAAEEADDRSTVREQVLADVRAHFDRDEDWFVPPPDAAFVDDHWFDFSYLDDTDEIERVWVNEPFAYVTIVYNDDARELRYHVVEAELDEFEQFVREDLTRILRNNLMYQDLEEGADKETLFTERTKRLMNEHAATVAPGSLHKLLYYLLRDFIATARSTPSCATPRSRTSPVTGWASPSTSTTGCSGTSSRTSRSTASA
jgi:flagellar protein FlaI